MLVPLRLRAAPRTREKGLQPRTHARAHARQAAGREVAARPARPARPGPRLYSQPRGAAFVSRRVLDPIFRHLNSGGEWKQHGFFWKDYEVSSW